MGGGEVFVCRLKEDNSNLYLDGSQANLTGPEGDVMVVFLEFWYKENGVKVFAIVSNQGGVEAGFVSGADIEAKIEYGLRSVHDLAVKRGIRGVLYEKRLCYSNDEQNPMRKPNTGMIDDILMKCKDTVMRGMNFSQLKGCSLMVGDASGLPGQFSDSDKVCAENAGIDYMDVITFVGK